MSKLLDPDVMSDRNGHTVPPTAPSNASSTVSPGRMKAPSVQPAAPTETLPKKREV